MKTLMIEDLSKNDEMDRTAMTLICGGRLPTVIKQIIAHVDAYTHGRCDTGPLGIGITCY